MKICIACLEEKHLDNFTKDKYVVGGYQHKCKTCRKFKVKADKFIYEEKECCECNITKRKDKFKINSRNIGGLSDRCLECTAKKYSNYRKNFYKENITMYKESARARYLKGRKYYLDKASSYYEENKEVVRAYRKEWQQKNSEKIYQNKRIRKKTDEIYSLRLSIFANIKSNLGRFLKGQKILKTNEILGCTVEELKVHIESQFLSWMNWGNHGNVCDPLEYNCSWDLDHLIPLSSAKTDEDVYRLNHWYNIQPLCSKVNRHIKKNTVPLLTNTELKITTI